MDLITTFVVHKERRTFFSKGFGLYKSFGGIWYYPI
jgi:hypothetical protein